MVCLIKMFKWRNISFKKGPEKIVLLHVKGLIRIIVKFRTEKKLCTFLSSLSHPLERGTKYSHWTPSIVQQYSEKGRIKINCFIQIAKAHFSYTIYWLLVSEKSIMAHTFLHHGGACMSQMPKQTTHRYKKKPIKNEFPIFLARNYYLHVYL